MCGFAGSFLFNEFRGDNLNQLVVHKMCNQMISRGPDAFGFWEDSEAIISFGHRRLSIIDLGSRADQPMRSSDDRYVIAFNGEIYNFSELRQELELMGDVFRTNSDTEVLLKLYARMGEEMLPRLRGMFAISIWDQELKTLFLARDPYGIKPLYISKSKNSWLFASQVKALLASGVVSDAPNIYAQSGFWLTGSVPEPATWFRDINALPSGSWCRITSRGELLGPNKYWDIGDSWRDAPECNMTAEDVLDVVKAAMSKSVRNHLVSDVPVGIFLSGGIDSGALAGLIRDSCASEIHGVTISFNEFMGSSVDEAPGAAEIAKTYGLRHSVRIITQKEFERDLPDILSSMDQPSIDGINTWYASKAAKELGLKVVISGVGGDELFYGYPSFNQIPKLNLAWRAISSVPGALSMINSGLTLYSEKSGNRRWSWLASQAGNLYGAYWLRRGLFTPDELPDVMGCNYSSEMLRDLNPTSLIESMMGPLPVNLMAAVGQMESMGYLRNQLLRDCDWASMAHSIELRTPLVDAWLLRDLIPVLRSFGRVKGKKMLSACPEIPLSTKIVERTKTGFSIPMNKWISGAAIGGDSEISSFAQGAIGSKDWAKILSTMVYRQ